MAGAVSSCAEYERLMTEAARHNASGNYHRADKVLRQAIALDPGVPKAYYNLGAILSNAKRNPEAVQCFLQAAARSMVGCTESWPGSWADSIANAFNKLQMEDCNEVPKPEWWSDEALKTLSKAVVCAVTHSKECPLQGPLQQAHLMRATVLAAGFDGDGDLAWESGPRSAAELKGRPTTTSSSLPSSLAQASRPRAKRRWPISAARPPPWKAKAAACWPRRPRPKQRPRPKP